MTPFSVPVSSSEIGQIGLTTRRHNYNIHDFTIYFNRMNNHILVAQVRQDWNQIIASISGLYELANDLQA